MIVLDTNVISELMRSQPHPAVTAWVAAQSRGSLYTTSLNEAELFYGISAMPEGRRRSGLAAGAEALFAEEFAGRVLVFGALLPDVMPRLSFFVARPANPSKPSTR